MTDPNMDKENSETYGETSDSEPITVSLTDELGRSLTCAIERSFEIDGSEYLLLSTLDAPIEIFAWEADEEDDEEENLVDIDEDEIDEIFSTARAVLAEHDLTLHRSAFTLTAKGPLPEASEEDIITLEIDDDEDIEEFQLLANFYFEEQAYAIYTPLAPLMFFARTTSQGDLELLSPEEFQAVRPELEDQIFEGVDD
ncbi:MAG: DUF3727 domain-containing protein [Elainellaceae cyanobacterium]